MASRRTRLTRTGVRGIVRDFVRVFIHLGVLLLSAGSQQICSAGPYRVVRHPGYSAGVVGAVGYVWILGSGWALVPAGLMVLLFVVRTSLEDATLKEELPGYREYAARTTRRLIPFVW